MMGAEKNRVTVKIFGQEYTIKGRGNPEYIRELAGYVDDIMVLIKKSNPKLSPTQVSVLAAINIADLYFASKWGLDGEYSSEPDSEE